MERLTKCDIDGCLIHPWSFNGINGSYDIWDEDLLEKQIDRLAAYEDTGLEPDEIKELCTDDVAEVAKMFRKMIESGEIKHLQDLLRAEKDGRLVVLPCKVGDTVYAAETSPVIPLSVAYVGVYLDGADGGDWEALENIGKTVFLTRKEAEAALAGKGGAK